MFGRRSASHSPGRGAGAIRASTEWPIASQTFASSTDEAIRHSVTFADEATEDQLATDVCRFIRKAMSCPADAPQTIVTPTEVFFNLLRYYLDTYNSSEPKRGSSSIEDDTTVPLTDRDAVMPLAADMFAAITGEVLLPNLREPLIQPEDDTKLLVAAFTSNNNNNIIPDVDAQEVDVVRFAASVAFRDAAVQQAVLELRKSLTRLTIQKLSAFYTSLQRRLFDAGVSADVLLAQDVEALLRACGLSVSARMDCRAVHRFLRKVSPKQFTVTKSTLGSFITDICEDLFNAAHVEEVASKRSMRSSMRSTVVPPTAVTVTTASTTTTTAKTSSSITATAHENRKGGLFQHIGSKFLAMSEDVRSARQRPATEEMQPAPATASTYSALNVDNAAASIQEPDDSSSDEETSADGDAERKVEQEEAKELQLAEAVAEKRGEEGSEAKARGEEGDAPALMIASQPPTTLLGDTQASTAPSVIVGFAVSRQAAHEVRLRDAGYEIVAGDLAGGSSVYPVRLWILRHKLHASTAHSRLDTLTRRPDVGGGRIHDNGIASLRVLHSAAPTQQRTVLTEAGFVEIVGLPGGATLYGKPISSSRATRGIRELKLTTATVEERDPVALTDATRLAKHHSLHGIDGLHAAGAWACSQYNGDKPTMVLSGSSVTSMTKVVTVCIWCDSAEPSECVIDRLCGTVCVDVRYAKDLRLPASLKELCEAEDLEVHCMAAIVINGMSVSKSGVSQAAAEPADDSDGDDWRWAPRKNLSPASVAALPFKHAGEVLLLDLDIVLPTPMTYTSLTEATQFLALDVSVLLTSRQRGAEAEVGHCLIPCTQNLFADGKLADSASIPERDYGLGRRGRPEGLQVDGVVRVVVGWKNGRSLHLFARGADTAVSAPTPPLNKAAPAPAALPYTSRLPVASLIPPSPATACLSDSRVSEFTIEWLELDQGDIRTLTLFSTECNRLNARKTARIVDDMIARLVVADMIQAGHCVGRAIVNGLVESGVPCAAEEAIGLLKMLRRVADPNDNETAVERLLCEPVDYVAFLQLVALDASISYDLLLNRELQGAAQQQLQQVVIAARLRRAIHNKLTKSMGLLSLTGLLQKVVNELPLHQGGTLDFQAFVSLLSRQGVYISEHAKRVLRVALCHQGNVFTLQQLGSIVFGVIDGKLRIAPTTPAGDFLSTDELRIRQSLRTCALILSHQRLEAALDPLCAGKITPEDLKNSLSAMCGIFVDDIDLKFIQRKCQAEGGSIDVVTFSQRYLDLSSEEQLEIRQRILRFAASKLLVDPDFVAETMETFSLFAAKPADALPLLAAAMTSGESVYRVASMHVPQRISSRHFTRACVDVGLPLKAWEAILLARRFCDADAANVKAPIMVDLPRFFSFAFTATTLPVSVDKPALSTPSGSGTELARASPPDDPRAAPESAVVAAVNAANVPDAQPTDESATKENAVEVAKPQVAPAEVLAPNQMAPIPDAMKSDTGGQSSAADAPQSNKLVIDLGDLDASTVRKLLASADPVQQLILAQLLRGMETAVLPSQSTARDVAPAVHSDAGETRGPPRISRRIEQPKLDTGYPLRGPFVPLGTARSSLYEDVVSFSGVRSENPARTSHAPEKLVEQKQPERAATSDDLVRSLPGDAWTCSICLHAGNPQSGEKCSVCSAPRAQQLARNLTVNWICTTCAFPNLPNTSCCIVCDKTLLPPTLGDVTSKINAGSALPTRRCNKTFSAQRPAPDTVAPAPSSPAPPAAIPTPPSATLSASTSKSGPFHADLLLSSLRRPAVVTVPIISPKPPTSVRLRDARAAALRHM